jgi:hypothetical protein
MAAADEPESETTIRKAQHDFLVASEKLFDCARKAHASFAWLPHNLLEPILDGDPQSYSVAFLATWNSRRDVHKLKWDDLPSNIKEHLQQIDGPVGCREAATIKWEGPAALFMPRSTSAAATNQPTESTAPASALSARSSTQVPASSGTADVASRFKKLKKDQGIEKQQFDL